MYPDQKKSTVKFIIVLIIIIIIAIALFSFVYKQNTESPVATNTPTTTNGFTPLNPTGAANNQPATNSRPVTTDSTDVNQDTKGQIVRQLIADPVTSAISTSTRHGIVVRYIDRASGHIFEIDPNTSDLTRITNTTIPKVLTARWATNASDVVMTYIKNDDVGPTDLYLHINETYPASTTPALLSVKTRVIGTGNVFTTISPSGDKLFYLGGVGSIFRGYLENIKDNELSDIWSSQISSWVANWVKDSTPVNGINGKSIAGAKISLYIKPISIGTGFGYLFDPNTKSLDKVGQGGKGFTMNVNRNATYAVTSTTENDTINTSFVNIKTSTSTIAPIRTMPEKCTWGTQSDKVVYCAAPSNIKTYKYPDAWYMGDIAFIDTLWKIDIETGEVTHLANLLDVTGVLIDAIDLNVAPNDQYLTFINKNDLSLWMLKLK